jgi:serine/threonine protein phosphatase 1
VDQRALSVFEGKLDRLIVHGHTPVTEGPDVRSNRVNIDTGAVFGRALTAAIFDERSVNPLRFLSA